MNVIFYINIRTWIKAWSCMLHLCKIMCVCVWFINCLNQMQSIQNWENEIGKLAEIYISEKASVAFGEPVTVWIQWVSDRQTHTQVCMRLKEAHRQHTRYLLQTDHLTQSPCEVFLQLSLCMCVKIVRKLVVLPLSLYWPYPSSDLHCWILKDCAYFPKQKRTWHTRTHKQIQIQAGLLGGWHAELNS